ncbi:hypothetical protein Tco_0597436, partial [Tanacetum coccineum]
TDNANITRKRSKPDKHEHKNGKSAKEPEESSKEGLVFIAERESSRTPQQTPQLDLDPDPLMPSLDPLFTAEAVGKEVRHTGLPRGNPCVQSTCAS